MANAVQVWENESDKISRDMEAYARRTAAATKTTASIYEMIKSFFFGNEKPG